MQFFAECDLNFTVRHRSGEGAVRVASLVLAAAVPTVETECACLAGGPDGTGVVVENNLPALLDVVQDLPDSVSSVLMCGHNPGLEDLILMLVPDQKGDALRDAVEDKFPTAAIAELQFDIDHWADANTNKARFTRLIRPRDLDPNLGPAMDRPGD